MLGCTVVLWMRDNIGVTTCVWAHCTVHTNTALVTNLLTYIVSACTVSHEQVDWLIVNWWICSCGIPLIHQYMHVQCTWTGNWCHTCCLLDTSVVPKQVCVTSATIAPSRRLPWTYQLTRSKLCWADRLRDWCWEIKTSSYKPCTPTTKFAYMEADTVNVYRKRN